VKRLIVFAAMLTFAIAAAATTIVPMTIEDLTTNSSAVIEGKAMEVWSAWDSQHQEILTYTRFSVSKTLKGSNTKQVVVAQIGGTVAGYTVKASGVRHFQVGESALLFLRPGETSDVQYLTAVQGNFQLGKDGTGDTVATNGMPDTFVMQGSKVVAYTGKTVSLGALEAKIRKAATK